MSETDNLVVAEMTEADVRKLDKDIDQFLWFGPNQTLQCAQTASDDVIQELLQFDNSKVKQITDETPMESHFDEFYESD